jgi:uncharacterized protein (TIGR02452 family)
MTKKTTLAEMAKTTLDVIDKGLYINELGNEVKLKSMIDFSLKNTLLYKPLDYDEVFKNRTQILDNQQIKTQFEVKNESTLAACQRLLNEDKFEKIVALNFASAKNPGGGFLGGAKAQEESLARVSGLYPSLLTQSLYYETHRAMNTCLYTDHIIYSPQVPVFRAENGDFLNQPYLVSFITSPAVNQNGMKAKSESKENFAKIPSVMRSRIEKILSIALIHQYPAIVLGAWGCGVFQNSPQEVAQYFAEFLLQNPIFKNRFQKVIFAILDHSEERRFIQPFEKQFCD